MEDIMNDNTKKPENQENSEEPLNTSEERSASETESEMPAEILPEEVRRKYGILPAERAYAAIHEPNSMAEAELAVAAGAAVGASSSNSTELTTPSIGASNAPSR